MTTRNRQEYKVECSMRPGWMQKGWGRGQGRGQEEEEGVGLAGSDDLLDAGSLEAAGAALLLDLTG